MKLRTSLMAAAALSLVVAACSNSATQAPAASQPAAPSIAASTAPSTAPAEPSVAAKKFRVALIMPSATTDLAFSQSMYQALVAEQAKAGGDANFEIQYTENMFNVPDAQAAIRDYASQGFDLVIAHGSQYGAGVEEIAKDFPAVSFAWGTDVNTFGLPNVFAYTAAAEEGGYVLARARVTGISRYVKALCLLFLIVVHRFFLTKT